MSLGRLFATIVTSTWLLAPVPPVGVGATAQAPQGPRPGSLSIRTDPPGATVFVDGKEIGTTPIEAFSLPAGGHRLRVVKEGYLENSRVVIVVAGNTDTLQIRLTAGASSTSRPSQGATDLRIVVVKGEDVVNIIQQKTAVAPIIEVRDRNNLPVSGAVVTFAIEGGKGAAFAGGVPSLTVATNAAGQAVATGFSPLASGAVQINVQAAFQGQIAAATIAQTNVLTVAEAAAAAGGTSGAGAGSGSGAGSSAGGGLSKAAIIGIAGAGAGALGLVAAAGGDDSAPIVACTFSVSPTSIGTVAGTASTQSVTISVGPAGCSPTTWVASSSSSFVTVSPSGGTGNGTVTVSVAANPTGSPSRTWSTTIAGQTVSGAQNQNFPPCNSQQVAGGDTPESRTIELGRTSGAFTFSYNTYSLPDRMALVYEGRVLFDTGCVGTISTRTQNLTYAGNASTVTVQVTPRCAGGSGTIWDFIVSCPR